jgi:hypothetical protein
LHTGKIIPQCKSDFENKIDGASGMDDKDIETKLHAVELQGKQGCSTEVPNHKK